MNSSPATVREVNVVELNPYAPRPFAFTEAALCLRDSIEAAGYESNLYINRTDSSAISVILGAVPPRLGPLDQLDPRRTIIFNFEQLGSDHSVASVEYLSWLRNWMVADYHSANVEYLKRLNGNAQQIFELPVVPGPSIAFRPDLDSGKSVDVLFFGSPNERRAEILRRLQAAGMSVESVAGAYAGELAPAIRRARVVLHAHFHDTALFPTARILQPVMDGVPIVCEASAFSALSDWSRSGIVFAEYDGLVAACRSLLNSREEQLTRAQRSRDFARQLEFAAPLRLMLEALAQMPVRAAQPEPRLQPPRPPELLRPPVASAPPPQEAGDEPPLSTAEIEAILEREMHELPPESDAHATPVKFVTRELGQGRFGRWAAWLLVAFSLLTIWQGMR
jgi:hypothetical protein